MKSQDIVILFKLISLELQAVKERATGKEAETLVFLAGSEWKGWEDSDGDTLPTNSDSYSVRALSASLALSKSEVSNSLNRCREIGLIHTNRLSGQPLVRREALLDFVKYGIRYVFPAKPGAVVRGIPTAFGAPI
jgi:DNA-binding transcriptional ArsR family regulator